ncbi:DUF87 domain-containing protein (plasmid) [Rubrobacter tropicus]|uniref:DUF87 domain-containing protein n=1 Tax=Rubrobacter tropicus TaxID=2653851 RepID=A0A6G8QGB1_9ACTN|nr:DUF87 domain-containing protein [Rubrobacter tropicus]QIN85510.1 DUF87 domain-containing protein [Rubrobacter tropicus]
MQNRRELTSTYASGGGLESYPILKSISEPHKVTGAAGISFEMRQVYILAAFIITPMVLYQMALRHLFTLSTGQAVAILAPLALVAFLCAFVKADGREFGWWFFKRTVGKAKERSLVWRGRDPRTLEELRDSVQAYMPAEHVYWDMLKSKTGVYSMILKVDPISLSLASVDDKQRTHDQLEAVYNRLDFPFVEVSRSRPGNVGEYTERTRELLEREILSGSLSGGPTASADAGASALTRAEERFITYGSEHLAWLEEMASKHNVYDRVAYIVLPHKPTSTLAESLEFLEELKSVFWRLFAGPLGRFFPYFRGPSAREAVAHQREAEKAYAILTERCAVIQAGYEPLGIRLTVLEGTEMLNVMREEAGGGDLIHSAGASKPAPQEFDAQLYSPVTLEVADGYGELTDHRLDQVLARVEANRKAAPPVVGMGELTIADRIAPEAVQIQDTYVKVNDTYHATLFVSELPDRVHFGVLDRFLSLQGKVKISKFIRPLDKDKAERLLSRKISQLIAAEAVTGRGNVRDASSRERAQDSAQDAYDKIMRDEESFFELAIVVHCEADSLKDLKALVEKTRTALKGALARAKLAREEMFEGYITGQLFGANHLTKRHCTRGILTKPLSCLFTFGSFRLEHENGTLYGLDKNSRSLAIVDHKVLNNQHMIIFGKSGMGKSFGVKLMSSRKRLRGESVILIDPEGNTGYDKVAHAMGGEYVVLGLGSPHKINPLELRDDYMNLSVLAGADIEEDEETATARARAGAFDGKVQKLVGLANLMAAKDEGLETNLSARLQGKLERIFVETYAAAGITRDPATHNLTPPTMVTPEGGSEIPSFFDHLAEAAKTDPELQALRDDLYQWEFGSMRTIYDGQTNVDLDSKYLVLQISAANEGKGRAPIMYSILDFISGRVSDREEAITCYVDEQWSLLKFQLAVDLMNELWRVGRVRNTSMVGITQDILEFTSSEKSETIIRLSACKMLLGQNRKTVDAISQYIDLSPEQKRMVTTFHKGEALLCVEEDRQIPITMIASDWEKRLFNTDPELEKQYRAQEARALEEAESSSAPVLALAPGASDREPAAALVHSTEGHALQQDLKTQLAEQRRDEAEHAPPPPPDARREAPAEDPATARPHSDPPPAHAHEHQTGGAANQQEEVGATDLPVVAAPSAPGAVFAVAGASDAGPVIAFNLAGVLAMAGQSPSDNGNHPSGARVVLVDADGALTAKLFSGVPDGGLDDLARALLGRGADNGNGTGPAPTLDDCLIREPESGLKALVHPDAASALLGRAGASNGAPDPSSLTAALIRHVREEVDLAVVVVGEHGRRTAYAREWLLAADGVVATGTRPDAIAAGVSDAEAQRGTNATLIAPMGRPTLPKDLTATRGVFTLPAASNRALAGSYDDGDFAPMRDPYAAKSFTALAREIAERARRRREAPPALPEGSPAADEPLISGGFAARGGGGG